ncbi:hypothetical protein ZTR_08147 [Talaromyces verruculosus]|nr:hypothetical protein ZTR_08147 [Talaromyces verruculosus]
MYTSDQDLSHNTPSKDSLPDYEIVKFQCGVSTRSELTILCYGKRFHIPISAEDLHASPQLEKGYLERLRRLEIQDEMLPIQYNDWQKTLIEEIDQQEKDGGDDGDDEMIGDAMEEMCFWIASKCNPSMKALGSDTDLQPVTVEQWLYHETLVLTPKIDERGILSFGSAAASDKLISDLVASVRLPQDLIQKLQIPLLQPSKISLFHDEDEDITGPIQRPEQVFIDPGEILFFKPCHRTNEIPREIETMTRLQQSGLDKTLRVPIIHGLVQYQEETDRICGLLLTYIKHDETLAFVNINETPLERRNKWISQIRQMIGKLHSNGIVWGDVKPDNILVDDNDDLWFIDFGGSYTYGWVDEDRAETMEGDCQGMERIVQFLLGEYEA